MWDLASEDGRTTAHKYAETPDEMAMREPQGYSTMIEADGMESGYATRANGAMDSAISEDARGSGENWNGQGNLELDRTVIERRQPKLTEKGKAYRLAEQRKDRNKLKREIQSRIAMDLADKLFLHSQVSVKEFSELLMEITPPLQPNFVRYYLIVNQHTPISTSLFLNEYAKENVMSLGITVSTILVVYPQIQHDGFCQ